MVRNIILIIAIISFSFSSLFAQTSSGVVVDTKQTPGLRKVEQKDGTQIFFLFNPAAMDKVSVKKATQELKEEIKFLEGQKEMMKKCGDCFEELVNEIDHNEKLLVELTKKKNNFIIKLPFKK